MVLWRSALGAMLLALSVPLAAPKAVAGEGEITFCNEFPHKVYVAIAYPQAYAPNVVWYLARGWLHIATGRCVVFDTAIRVRTFYYHAESEPYKEGKKKIVWKWGADKQFAVRDAHFHFYDAERKFSGMYFAEFSKGPESADGPLTCTVKFLEDGRSMTIVPNKGGGNQLPPPSADEGARASPPSGDGSAPAAPDSEDSPN
jgi:uncharacterized membrane protein